MLIRSILDYGAAAYDSASISQLRKLDKIQYSALKLCFGAIKSTAASALQVESGEAPLHLRRLEQQIKFSIKIKASVNHAANSVLQDHWTTHYGKFTDNSRPLATKVDQFFQHMTLNIVQTTVGKIPPWHIVLPDVDQTLASQVKKKKDAPHILNALNMPITFIYILMLPKIPLEKSESAVTYGYHPRLRVLTKLPG